MQVLQGQLPGRKGPAGHPPRSRALPSPRVAHCCCHHHHQHLAWVPAPATPSRGPKGVGHPMAKPTAWSTGPAHLVRTVPWRLPSTHGRAPLFQQTSLTKHMFKEKLTKIIKRITAELNPSGPLCDSGGCTPVKLALIIIMANMDRTQHMAGPGLRTHSVLTTIRWGPAISLFYRWGNSTCWRHT